MLGKYNLTLEDLFLIEINAIVEYETTSDDVA
jgi:hypothetical protein